MYLQHFVLLELGVHLAVNLKKKQMTDAIKIIVSI